MTQEVTDNDFEKEVIKSTKPVLVDFWAPWCGPCKMLTPIIEQLAEEMGNEVKIVKMNIDENPSSPSSFGVRSIPTLMLFKDGKEIAVKVGVHPKTTLSEWINESV